MADSQNMLVTLQFYLLKIMQRIVIKQVNMGFIFFQKIKSKTEQNSTLKLIPSKYRNKSQDRYILFSTLDFLEKKYIY